MHVNITAVELKDTLASFKKKRFEKSSLKLLPKTVARSCEQSRS
jgi:hypothetical protein